MRLVPLGQGITDFAFGFRVFWYWSKQQLSHVPGEWCHYTNYTCNSCSNLENKASPISAAPLKWETWNKFTQSYKFISMHSFLELFQFPVYAKAPCFCFCFCWGGASTIHFKGFLMWFCWVSSALYFSFHGKEDLLLFKNYQVNP